jgi:hypothetical protein
VIELGAADRAAREEFVLGLRPARDAVDPSRPYGFFVEEEPRGDGGTLRAATILLTNRECPWHCLMCDLWKNTLEAPTPKGAIPQQIRFALERLPPADTLKLYNAGSFFDRAAIPREDHEEIASLARGFERVVVGLETANEEILRRLNKGMTVADFRTAASFLLRNRISLRVFVLVGLPFLPRKEWAAATRRSVETSFRAGAGTVSLIPTRLGNGTLEELRRQGQFQPPTLRDLEMALEDFFEGEEGRAPATGLVLADLWDADALAAPPCCAAARVNRLRKMNLIQRNLPLPPCPSGCRHS